MKEGRYCFSTKVFCIFHNKLCIRVYLYARNTVMHMAVNLCKSFWQCTGRQIGQSYLCYTREHNWIMSWRYIVDEYTEYTMCTEIWNYIFWDQILMFMLHVCEIFIDNRSGSCCICFRSVILLVSLLLILFMQIIVDKFVNLHVQNLMLFSWLL